MSAADEFYRQFRAFEVDAQATLGKLEVTPDAAAEEALSKRLAEQQRLLNETADSLAVYDLGRYQSTLSELEKKLAASQARTKPKPKFAFKSRRAVSAAVVPAADPDASLPSIAMADIIPVQPGSVVIQDQASVLRKLDSSTHQDLQTASTVTIDSLKDCLVDLRRKDPYNSVTLRNLSNCQVLAGVSSSSLFMDACTSCKIEAEAQQFRIHSSNACEVRYTCRAGRPIIEQCRDMRFANMAGTEVIVDDFDDLSNSRRNWSVLKDASSG